MDLLSSIFQDMVYTAKNAFITIDKTGKIIVWNKQAEDNFGWSCDEILGKSIFDFLIPVRLKQAYSTSFEYAISSSLYKNVIIPVDLILLSKDEKEIMTHLNIHSIELEGEVYFIADIYVDYTKNQFSLLDLTRDSIFVIDQAYNIVFWNKNSEQLYGYTQEEAIGKNFITLLQPNIDSPKIYTDLSYSKLWEGEITFKHKKKYDITVNSKWALDSNNSQGQQVIITNMDLTRNKSYQKKIHYLITHDTLTGLGNRALLEDRLDHAICQANKRNSLLAILIINLNRFKKINDHLGHEQGDLFLKEIARRLNDVLCKGDTIVRLGGNEFVILAENIQTLEDIAHIAERILLNIEKPFLLNEQEVNVSGSLGISVFPKDAKDHASLMKMADIAMYQAKEMGTSAFRFYDPEMNNIILSKFISENSLHRAITQKEFTLYYQPRINSKTKKITSVEALVRWKDPLKGIISPVDFIPLAEEIGLVGLIGEWVLFEACQQNKLWQNMGFPPIKIAVNLSTQQLSNINLVSIVSNTLLKTGLDAKFLELEITESGLMKNINVVTDNLQQLRKLGIHISIDDFGTGYSSLSYLKKLPIDTLKIDQSFMSDLGNNHEDDAIVTATISMAHGMSMHVVAEGVNTLQQVNFLIEKSCDEMQGFLFSEPYPPEIIQAEFQRETWF